MKKVYCLYRVSDPRQVQDNDIPMQRIACHTYAECHGWEIVREFTERGVSGYKLHMEERDAIIQIKEAALLEKFDILLVFMFDRIGRRDDETPFVIEWLVRHGVAVWSVCEGEQRFDNHVDKLTNYIRSWQAAAKASASPSGPGPGSGSSLRKGITPAESALMGISSYIWAERTERDSLCMTWPSTRRRQR